MSLKLEELREDYRHGSLDETDTAAHPFDQFKTWFAQARRAELPEPNAMVLATQTPGGGVAARVVLLKELSQQGFVFYSNYTSRKGQELAANPAAALVFNWLELQRQVRIEGTVERLAPEQSTEYFQSRPRGSQLGAWASPQSEVIASREVLEARYEAMQERFAGQEQLPRPEHWGGYLLVPHRIEFWQGRSSRLHDRIEYWREAGQQAWTRRRLAP
jgi:pyridoxamine 5'-phosphate oxidase